MSQKESLEASIGGITSLAPIVGMALSSNASVQQTRDQMDLMKYQQDLNFETMDKAQGLAKDMYEYTGYSSKVRQLKEAGLNPALLYGGGGAGAGGSTAGAASGIGVSGGSPGNRVQEQSNKIQTMGMGLQLAKMKSEIAVNEASAEKLKADATKTSGVDTVKTGQEVENLKASLELIGQQTQNAEVSRMGMQLDNTLKGIQNDIAGATEDWQIQRIGNEAKKSVWEINKALGESQSALAKGKVDQATINTVINQYKLNLEKSAAEILKTKTDTVKSEEETRAIIEQVKQGYDKLRQGAQGMEIETMKIEAMLEQTLYNNKTTMNVEWMRTIKDVFLGILKVGGEAAKK